MISLFAILPFAILFFLMAVLKKPAIISAPITLITTILISYFIWEMEKIWIITSLIKGALISFDIIFIIFGAIVLLYTIKASGAFNTLKKVIGKISLDKRIQVIIVGWFFVSFLEGIAGFGTPAMLAAPILIFLGISPFSAVVISLIGDSVAVTFGAIGVPITIGIAEGINMETVQEINILGDVAIMASFIHLIIGALIPFFMLCILSLIETKSLKMGLESFGVAIIAGFLFTIPLFLYSIILTPEFPSVLASLTGVIIFIFLIKKKIIGIKNDWKQEIEENDPIDIKNIIKAFLPYILIIITLIISRIPLFEIGNMLKNINLTYNSILGTNLNHIINIAYSPGFLFILVSMFSIYYYKLNLKEISLIFNNSFKKLFKPFVALFFILGIVQILILSSNNLSGLPSIPMYLAEIASKTSFLWPFASVIMGALGSFMTGSSTVSNLLFSSFQVETAISLGGSIVLSLSLQLVGSSIGNMIAIHNILAVQATVGMKNMDGKILGITIIPTLIYILLSGLLGLILSIFII